MSLNVIKSVHRVCLKSFLAHKCIYTRTTQRDFWYIYGSEYVYVRTSCCDVAVIRLNDENYARECILPRQSGVLESAEGAEAFASPSFGTIKIPPLISFYISVYIIPYTG